MRISFSIRRSVFVFQHRAVQRHSACLEIDINRIAAQSDDALDQRVSVIDVAVHHHHIAALGRIQHALYRHAVPAVKRRLHGNAGNGDDAHGKHKKQYDHRQREHQ